MVLIVPFKLFKFIQLLYIHSLLLVNVSVIFSMNGRCVLANVSVYR